MTTTYTRQQLQEARRAAQEAAYGNDRLSPDEDVWVDAFAAALGLTVEDPKPEPGAYLTRQGDVLIVNTERDSEYPDALWLAGKGGRGRVRLVNAHQGRATWHPLAPAAVVSSEWLDAGHGGVVDSTHTTDDNDFGYVTVKVARSHAFKIKPGNHVVITRDGTA